MGEDSFHIKVEGKLENLPVIAEFIESVLEQLGADAASANRIQLAVDEACTNIITHAYAGTSGHVELLVEMKADELVIVIGDKGKAFDPRSVPPPDLDADLENRKIGGLGMYFMNSLMDEISYSFDDRLGNRLTMKKKLSLKKNTV